VNKATRWILFAAVGTAAVVAASAATQPPNLGKVLAQQRELVAGHPYDPAALNDLGNLLQLAGEPPEAEAAYRRALELSPDLISARYNLALLLQRGDRFREAMAEYHEVLARMPSHAWARYQIGSIYDAQGDDRRAVRWYGEAFALEPRLAVAEYNPRVIENDLVEEAMLTGYRAEGARPLAPQVYEEPIRIRELMLPRNAAAGGDLMTGDEAPIDETGEPEEAVMPAASRGPAETLDAGSLDSREVNQASPQGRSPRRRNVPSQAQTTRRTFQRPDGSSTGGSQAGAVGTPGTVIVQPGLSAPQPGAVDSGTPRPGQPRVIAPPGNTGTRFRSGVGSTGRLELQLVPEVEERRG
jgi:Tfp pilus assembly protein PilF